MVSVTKDNFIEQSNDLLRHLPTAAFVAIDEEMTGISLPSSDRPSKDDTPEERYLKTKPVPERYSIIQVGIALFHQHDDYPSKEFQVRRYNFYLFPPTDTTDSNTAREVTMNPSSIAFLNEHGMDFNKWTKDGIPYVTEDVATLIVNKYRETREKSEAASAERAIVRDPTKRRVQLTKTEDVNFHARAMASLREWLDGTNTTPNITGFLLPACNAFLRRALYESIELEYPALILENAGSQNRDQIRVLRLSEEEKRERQEQHRVEAWEKMIMSIGFTRVFRAISNACRGFREVNSIVLADSVDQVSLDAQPELKPLNRRIPLIVHNGMMDLLFLMTHFASHSLPSSYQEVKVLLHDTFPLIYDTKILSTECSVTETNTILENLYNTFVKNDESSLLEIVDHDITWPDQAHEASYDAYMTGAVFFALSKRIQIQNDYGRPDDYSEHSGVASLHHVLAASRNDSVEKVLFGRNKLYLMATMYSIDLEDPKDDPFRRGLSPSSTTRVSGIDPAVTTQDIVRCLSNLTDPAERRIQFEVVWVDGTCFMVAARHNSCEATLKRHGELIHSALRRRFAVEEICTLQEHIEAIAKAKKLEEAKGRWSSGLWSSMLGLFGFRSGKRKQDDVDVGSEPNAKRRRTS